MIFSHVDSTATEDLPIPLWLFNYQAVAVIIGSVILLSLFWNKTKLKPGTFSREIKSPVILNSWRFLNAILRICSLALFCVVLFATLFGDLGGDITIARIAIFVIFWVGLIIVSGFLGNAWKILSPWDTLALSTKWIKDKIFARSEPTDRPLARTIPQLPSNIITWIAVSVLFIFLWLELVHPEIDNSRLLGFSLLIYTILLLTGASLWGRNWLKEADAFYLLHKFIGSLGIFSRRRIHVPGTRSVELDFSIPKVIFLLVLLGSTTFDGLLFTDFYFWKDERSWANVPVNTMGLIVTIALVGACYFIAMMIAGKLTKTNPYKLINSFAHSLIPIALAYSIAHYFSLLINDGQDFLVLLSDPLGRGWNLFGTGDLDVNYQLLSATTIAWIKVISIFVGHLWGIFLAHDRALSLWQDKPKLANRSQYPLVLLMVGYTLLGSFLALNS